MNRKAALLWLWLSLPLLSSHATAQPQRPSLEARISDKAKPPSAFQSLSPKLRSVYELYSEISENLRSQLNKYGSLKMRIGSGRLLLRPKLGLTNDKYGVNVGYYNGRAFIKADYYIRGGRPYIKLYLRFPLDR